MNCSDNLKIGGNFGNKNMELPTLKGVGIISPTNLTQTSTPEIIPKGIMDTREFLKSIPSKISEFLTPKNPEDAMKMGMLPIKKSDGNYLYVDITGGFGGLKIVGEKITGKVAQRVVPKIVEELDTPIQKVINALKEAKSLRKIQETLYTKERGEKLAKALAVGEKVKGEAGFIAEKAQLRGELLKVQFESIRDKVGQMDIDDLFIRVKESPFLTEWEKLPAREGLSKLFGKYGGAVPTENEIGLLNKVFPEEFIGAVLEKRPLLTKIGEAIGQAANVPRSYMSSLDLSFGGRQGIFAAPRFRKEFFRSWTAQFKEFGSETAYKEAMENITKNPLFELARDSRVSFTNVGRIMSQREEAFMSQWAERIPIIGEIPRASSRAYTGFANKFRMDIFTSMIKNAERLGLNPTKNPDLTKQIASFVNNATGRGSLGGLERAATALNAFFFSPRLAASRLRLLVPAEYIKADPFIRKEYLKSLFSFAGTMMTILGLAKMAGADVGLDWRSADFGKIKIEDTRIDIMGGFQQYMRMAGQLYTGQYVSSTTGKVVTLGEGYKPLSRLDILMRMVETKEAPIFSFITDLLRGQTYTGEPINLPVAILQRFIPMAAQDIYDVAKDNPGLLPLSTLGIFGVGLQTYQPQPSKSPTGYPSLKTKGMQMPSLKGIGTFK